MNDMPSLVELFEQMNKLGYAVFKSGDYDLNLFGIRSKDLEPTTFNDWLGCAYKKNGEWQLDYWPATTDPGLYWRENPSNVNGTAILVPNQYRSTYTIDLHSGKYLALCQRAGEVTVWRDADRDVLNSTSTSARRPATLASTFMRVPTTPTTRIVTVGRTMKWASGRPGVRSMVRRQVSGR